ncbi:MAG: single-stranded-DNA-specific exonuclease RecJ [Gemmatimonadaceae bacterium]
MTVATEIPTSPKSRWLSPPAVDDARVQALASALAVPTVVARLLVARGCGQDEVAKHFLRPRLEHLHDPALMTGLDVAVSRLSTAIAAREPILVHGDYDVDGMCSSTILVRTLRSLGGVAQAFIPHRMTDGYDLGEAGVRAAIAIGAKVVVTCDCGTSAHRAVEALQAEGIDVIITDHHLPSVDPPRCLAVLNPRVPGNSYPDKDLCAAGVVFKLALGLLRAHGQSPNIAMHMLDLVALATVADVAPLRGENRVLVRYGLRLLHETSNVGLRALLMSSGLEEKVITAGRVGFILAPRLNAVGRLDRALRGVELLMSEESSHALTIARDLEELNKARQDLDREMLVEARGQVERQVAEGRFGIVLASEGWHPGVIGIVASRLVEEFNRPTMLVALQDGVGKGSGRSIPAFDLHGGLTACRDLLVRYGGHRAAAGITIDPAQMDAFAQQFDRVAKERLTPNDLIPEVRVDLEVSIDEVNLELERLLRHFEPYGIGNPAPTLVSRGVRLATPPKVLADRGVRLRFATASGDLTAIWWGNPERAADLKAGSLCDIAYRLELDTYFNEPRLTARIVDLRR